MKTRRQARIEASVQAPSPPSPKKRKSRKQNANKSKPRTPSPSPKKRAKKAKQPSPQKKPTQKLLSPQAKKGRGRPKKKDQRVTQQHSNQKYEKKSDDKQKQNAKSAKKKQKQQQEKKTSPAKSNSPHKKTHAKVEKQEEIKKVIVKGAAPVDEYFDKGKDFHVLVHNNKIYSATLNQTNISHNNNKYYAIQILQSDSDPNKCYFFTRWGRVGTPGQKSYMGPYPINRAVADYNAKYYEKNTKGDYRELDLNFGDDEPEDPKDETSKDPNKTAMTDYQESKLPKPTKDLINLIFDIGMMNRQMKQIGYNVNKMPLGKLSKQNIKKGYNVLKQLHQQLSKRKQESVVEELTNEFYSLIPHDVGFQKMRQFKLDTLDKVKQKLDMLQSLSEIKIATEILGKKEDGNAIDNNYKKLNREIEPIQKDSFTYKLLNEYLQTTHATTHRGYDLELIDLFKLQAQHEHDRYTEHIHNKMLLWHGSRLTNYVGILSQGLRIAPPEAPVTGYMFGKGVYFADMSSKSANYCFTNPENNTGILILCEVAVGDCNEKLNADPLAANLPDGKHSTKGMGRTAPKAENFQVLDGVIVPMGPGYQTNIASSLLYNQFIVYKVEQVKIKYLLRVKFHYKRH